MDIVRDARQALPRSGYVMDIRHDDQRFRAAGWRLDGLQATVHAGYGRAEFLWPRST